LALFLGMNHGMRLDRPAAADGGAEDVLVFLKEATAKAACTWRSISPMSTMLASAPSSYATARLRVPLERAASWLGLMAPPPAMAAVVTSQSECSRMQPHGSASDPRGSRANGTVGGADAGELIDLAQAADLIIIGQVKPGAKPAQPGARNRSPSVAAGRR
jgi:hypothetical protein